MTPSNHHLNRLAVAFLSGWMLIAMAAAGCGVADPGSTLPTDESVGRSGSGTLVALLDSDSDGLPDIYDPAPTEPDANSNDVLDGYDPEYTKNLTIPYDPAQPDLDSDEDGIPDRLDPEPLNPDANGNGIMDGLESDFDWDGLVDALDHYPDLPDANCNGVLDGEDPSYDNTADYPAMLRGGEIVCGGGSL